MGLPKKAEGDIMTPAPWEAKTYEEINGDFIAQAKRARSMILANYYKAMGCLQEINNGVWTFNKGWENTVKFINLFGAKAGPDLEAQKVIEGLKILTGKPTKTQKTSNTEATPVKEGSDASKAPIMQAHNDIVDEMKKCFKLLGAGDGYLGRQPYYELNECDGLVTKLLVTADPIVSQYCMPEQAK
jgi:hypothetical protein